MPIWFDLILILSFAWTGLLFGFISIMDIEDILKNKISDVWKKCISAGSLFLSGFGIYIGRYLRWNSWDIITQPFNLLFDIGSIILHPRSNPGSWGMTVLMGLLLNMLYWSLRFIRNRNRISYGHAQPNINEI